MLRTPSPLRALLSALTLAATAVACPSAGAQTIRNTATLSFSDATGPRTLPSNTVELDRAKRPTSISFRRFPVGFVLDDAAVSCDAEKLLVTPDPISEQEYEKSQPLVSRDLDEAVIYVLDAQAENKDPTKIEMTWLKASSGVREIAIVLPETGPDTGIFAGALPGSTRNQANPSPCDISADGTGWIRLDFSGSDGSFASSNMLLIDPEGEVFDSLTGEAIDGATVTIIDDATGKPAATVYGDDGVSAYPNSVVTGSTVTDAGGWVYKLSQGNFRFPLLPPGRYRLQVTPPAGYRAPSERPASELNSMMDPYGRTYSVTDASYGKVFELKNPEPLTIDIPIDPEPVIETSASQLLVEKTASVADASAGDLIGYAVRVHNIGAGTATKVRVEDTLPQGLRYRRGSTRGVAEPEVAANGRTLRFIVPTLSTDADRNFTYLVSVGPDTPTGAAVNRAVASDSYSTSAVASASVRIRAPLFSDAMTLIGRVTEGACGDPLRGRKGVAGVRLVLEDGTFTLTDKDGLYHFEGVRPGTHVVQVDTATMPVSFAPVTCDRDTRSAGSGISRFIEGSGGSLHRADFQLRRIEGAIAKAVAQPQALDDAAAAGNREDWLAQAAPGKIDWLFPQIDHNPRAPALRVVIQHLPGQRVALSVNGRQVDPLSFEGSESDTDRNVAVSRWTGLPLIDRDNRVEARVLDAAGATVATLTRTVHYANVPAQAVLVPERSTPVADGVSRPQVAVRVTDRDGKPVRAGTLVPFRVDQPYAAAIEADAQQGRALAGLNRSEAIARVTGDDGIALIALQPTTQAGNAQIAITFTDEAASRTSDIRAWLSAPARDWMVVGFGKGTIGYETLARRSRGMRSHDVVTDGQLALYAKGRIRGSWLLTMAYDSDRKFDRDRGLLGTIDPSRYYTVYADGSAQGYDAATAGKLYLRLERRDFYALFGDFETGFTESRLTRYSRTLNGAKAELAKGAVHLTAFAARTDERYGRDEIQGNGLSGPYRLSARDIVPNSDKLRLETRDRLRAERIVETRQLTRHVDYDIDAIAGTLRFREPILSRDIAGNPVFIVADYETYGRGRKVAAGARAAASVAKGKVQFGATILHDEAAGDATVAGVDLRAQLTLQTQLRAEAAIGGRSGLNAGQALSTEIEHHDSNLDLLAYARSQEVGFGTGQQNVGEAGTTRYGVDGRLRLGNRIAATLAAWHQDSLVADTSRLAADARIEYRRDQGTLYVGTQIAKDSGLDGKQRDSRLLMLGGTQRILSGKIELDAQAQLPVGGKDESIDFPARQRIGAAWRITDDVRLIGGYEIARGDEYTAHAARIGFDVAPWSGGKLLSTLNQQRAGENGRRTFAQYGLSQSLPLGKRWTIDATLDASQTLSGAVPDGGIVDPFLPASTGGVISANGREGDFIAVTFGAGYRGDRWSWTGRAEYRTSDESRRIGFTSSLLRTLSNGGTLASNITAHRVTERDGSIVSSASADLALALRPLDSRWAVLERFQLRHEQADIGASANNVLAIPVFAAGDQATLRAINNVAVSYRTGQEGGAHGLEASLYYGAKYVRGRYAGESVDGFFHMAGFDLRKDLGKRVDIGGNASVRHSLTDGTVAWSAGPSVGVSPAGNVWISAGYNIAGYRDRDFEQDRYTRQGAYLTLRVRLDRELLGRKQ